jgi:hypothetical protein
MYVPAYLSLGWFVFVCKRNFLLWISSKFCSADRPNNMFYVSMVFSLQVLMKCPRVTISCWDTNWCDYLPCLELTISRITSTYFLKLWFRMVKNTTLHKPTVIHSYAVCLNLLKPTGHVMHHQQFNIQQLYALPTLYLCVLYLSENKQRLVPLTA